MNIVRLAVILPALLIAAGCVTPGDMADLHRMPAYRPATEDIVLDDRAEEPATVVTEPVAGEAGAVEDAAGGSAGVVDVIAPDAVSPVADVPATEAVPEVSEAARPLAGQRVLSRGDRIMISLRGIPRAEEIKNVIDGLGEVTLPYIGQVRVAGLTPSEAERLIEITYIDGGIYRNINVIVVAEDKVYFVQGEVARQGKFSMSGDVTLLQAITEAGGYTPFANRKNVKIIRGDQVLFFDARDIANGKTQDPGIMSDDIIVVQRSVF